MRLSQLLRSVELFDGLTDEQFELLRAVFTERTYGGDETVFRQGDDGAHLYVVRAGFVEVIVGDSRGNGPARTIVNLGAGQVFGEMALVDRGKRSATVRSLEDGTTIAAISREDFNSLCEQDNTFGYVVMRNMAADLSFKLRHRNLETRRG